MRRLWNTAANAATNLSADLPTDLPTNSATISATISATNLAADFATNLPANFGDLFAIGFSDATVHDQNSTLTLHLPVRPFETWIAKKGVSLGQNLVGVNGRRNIGMGINRR